MTSFLIAEPEDTTRVDNRAGAKLTWKEKVKRVRENWGGEAPLRFTRRVEPLVGGQRMTGGNGRRKTAGARPAGGVYDGAVLCDGRGN
mgnify:CR=1 FL=1|jgi:hypothetical protein